MALIVLRSSIKTCVRQIIGSFASRKKLNFGWITTYQSNTQRKIINAQELRKMHTGVKRDGIRQTSSKQRVQETADVSKGLSDVGEYGDYLELNFQNKTTKLNYLWLRDHCRCDQCFNHVTNQRRQEIHHFPANVQPVEYRSTENKLTLTWPDGHVSEYDKRWLLDHSFPHGQTRDTWRKFYWNQDLIWSSFPQSIEFSDHMTSDECVGIGLKNIIEYGFTAVENVPPNDKTITDACQRICAIQPTCMFEDLWTLKFDPASSDASKHKYRLRVHTDNAYMMACAGLVGLQVVHHDGSGGESLFVDGFNAAEQIRKRHPEAFDCLTKTLVPHQYVQNGSDVRYSAEILKVNPVTKELMHIRYNPYDRAPFHTVTHTEAADFYAAYAHLAKEIENPENLLSLKLPPTSLILFDNMRLIHGRDAYTGKRVVKGCFLPYDFWMSRARGLLP